MSNPDDPKEMDANAGTMSCAADLFRYQLSSPNMALACESAADVFRCRAGLARKEQVPPKSE